ncbi:DUF3592 domain-containing protein [Corynebacterium variabile]|uniref:DUF3592 domain-containing protein n=2 Tax=Corynebacterium variabile TaxID=1727 RepID=UPI0002002E67|nr:DUF3592 domain-containing protein [Corynebacterium variabile]
MTTIDPAHERQLREASYPGSTTAAVRLGIHTAFTVLVGVLLGIAVGALVGQLRAMAMLGLNETSEWFDNGVPLWLFVVGLVVGIPLMFAAAVNYNSWNHRYSGNPDRIIGVTAAVLAMAGVSVALWIIGMVLWPEPETFGVRDRSEWDGAEWTVYWMKAWGPALVTAATVLMALGGATVRRNRDRRRAELEHLMATGRRVPGVVTEISRTPSPEASKTQLNWTFSFPDDEGNTRWVERQEFFTAESHPVVGATVWVLFDPADPGNLSRIHASLTDSDDPADYTTRGM